jgi:molecular chaperone GrpE
MRIFKRKMKENKEANELADKAAETPVEEEAVKTDATGEEAAASEEAAVDGKAEKPAEPDWKALYAITLADFDNYKKRAARDREDVYRYAESDILKDVLPSVDNLALALDKAADKEDPFVKGVQLVYDTLLKALEGHGAKPMENPLGKELDPNFHEAIATLPDEKYEEGKISNIVKTGWMLGDKLLRVAQVVVSSGKKQ